MKKLLQDFKDFALKGSVVDLAIGVLIGTAFQGVVTSFTNNIISPIIGIFAGKNFDSLSVNIGFGSSKATLTYGAFITSIVNFLIMAFIVFLMARGINRVRNLGKKQKDASATTKICPFCYTEIPVKASRCPACTSVLEETNKTK